MVDGHGGGIVVVLGTLAIRVVDIDELCGGSVLDTGSGVDHCDMCVCVFVLCLCALVCERVGPEQVRVGVVGPRGARKRGE